MQDAVASVCSRHNQTLQPTLPLCGARLNASVNATGLRTALWRYNLGAELPLVAGCRRSQHGHLQSVLGKRIANLTGLNFQELKDRQSLRFCGESDVLCNSRSVIVHAMAYEAEVSMDSPPAQKVARRPSPKLTYMHCLPSRLHLSLGGQYANSTGCPALRRLAMWMVSLVSMILVATPAFADRGFDEKYERVLQHLQSDQLVPS